jgi:hypothetical protein
MMKRIATVLESEDACIEALRWLGARTNLNKAWCECSEPDWLLWLAARGVYHEAMGNEGWKHWSRRQELAQCMNRLCWRLGPNRQPDTNPLETDEDWIRWLAQWSGTRALVMREFALDLTRPTRMTQPGSAVYIAYRNLFHDMGHPAVSKFYLSDDFLGYVSHWQRFLDLKIVREGRRHRSIREVSLEIIRNTLSCGTMPQ